MSYMKKLFIVAGLFLSMNLSAQVVAGFGCKDADAWFDKEIYFWCQNVAVNYYGYPMYLNNVSLVADGARYDLQGSWSYGTYIFLDASNGVKLNQGSLVSVYVGGQYIGTWKCMEKNPTAMDVIRRAWESKPKTKTNANGLLKFIKKIL